MNKDKQVEIIAAVYPDREHAKVTLDMLHSMHSALTISLVDAAIVTKDEDGKVKIGETREVTTRKGAKRGMIVTGILGVIYPPSLIASLALGGALGGLVGRIRDTGIKLPQLEDVAERLTPGKVALVVLVEADSTLKAQNALEGFEGTLVVQPLDDETVQQLLKAAEFGS
jgi:uncharacterized membrane protein